jgi:hypothetical protein
MRRAALLHRHALFDPCERVVQTPHKTVSITRDHSPDEESELLRIEVAGGKVTQEIRRVRSGCCGLWVRPPTAPPLPSLWC